MSVLKADTIQSTGGGAATLTKQMAARAWINVPTGQASITASLNVSSLDDDGTGDGGVNLTSAMSDANYTITTGENDMASSTAIFGHDLTNSGQATTGYDFNTFYVNASSNRTDYDMQTFSVMHGDLA